MARDDLTARTDAKLRYAKLHIQELRDCSIPGQGHDFERAHLEAFFAQLFGAYASLLQELNEDLGCSLKPSAVSLGKLREAMKTKGPVNPKLTQLHQMDRDATSWFAKAKCMRDHVTHIGGIPMVFNEGGPKHGVVELRDPKTLQVLGSYFLLFESWVNEMQRVVAAMRV